MATKKWAAFKGILPQYSSNDPERFEVVKSIKATLFEFDNSEIAKQFSALKVEKDALKEKLSNIEIELDARNEILTERFLQSGLNGLKLDTGESFSLRDEPYTQAEDKDQINDWLVLNDMDELRTIAWQSLNAINKERLENGLPEVPGTKIFMKSQVVMRKG